jgi:C4-dicarboxylate transporter, DctM subunit
VIMAAMSYLSDYAGIVAILVMFVLMILSVPVFVATGVAALIGFSLVRDGDQVLRDLSDIIWSSANIYELVAIPLFIFTGLLMQQIGAGADLFDVTKAWVGSIRNSLGVATILACGIFAAICGSSIATAATVGIVAIPLLRADDYSQSQAGGFVAGGGTLGIIVPPSVPMILYGVTTETSIGKLFLAGIVPGIIMMTLFVVYVVLSKPAIRRSHAVPLVERLRVTRRGLPVLLLPVIIISSIYAGFFTPTETGALAIAYVVLVGLIQRRLHIRHFTTAAGEATKTACMLFMLVVFGEYLAHLLTFVQLPNDVTNFISARSAGPLMTVTLMMIGYLILGSFLETAAMLLVSVPLFFPISASISMDPIVFGVFVCIAMEISQIHPPIGVNLFTIHGISRIPLTQLAKGTAPFLMIQTAMLYVIYYIPQLSLWLPYHAFNR